MNPNMEWIAPLTAIMFMGSAGLIGFRMWLHRPPRLKDGSGEDVQRLAETVEALHDQVLQLRGDVSDLHERVDFAERLLTKGE